MDESTLSYDERRRLLFDSFGSTKKKRALRSQQANVVEMKSVVGAGDGMMDALGKQGDGAVSQSNLEAMEEVRKGEGDDGKGGLIPSMTVRFLFLFVNVHDLFFWLCGFMIWYDNDFC